MDWAGASAPVSVGVLEKLIVARLPVLDEMQRFISVFGIA